MTRRHLTRAARLGAAAVLLATLAVPLISASALGEESLTDLKARMKAIRADLDAVTLRIEQLHADEENLETRIERSERRKSALEKTLTKLSRDAVARADALYRSGGTGEMVEVLFGSQDLTELQTRVETISQVAGDDTAVFVELAREKADLVDLTADLAEDEKRLAETTARMKDESALLLKKIKEVKDEYEDLQRKLAAARAAAAPAQQSSALAPSKDPVIKITGGMVCPVAGPVSFIDSWGYPRSGGRSHEGVDMMADYGTPAVAIVPGTITTDSAHSLAGNYLVLTGNNGHQYYYAHNQRNIASLGQRVAAGEVIAEVGDTGNAAGTPHLHFEYHPGGGGAVNPYPLVAPLC